MQTSGGATALMYACQQCRESQVLEILKKQPYSVKDRDRTLKTPLHYCAENPNTSCAEAILKVAPELVNSQDENGYSTLHLAVIAGNKPLIKLLITKGADVNIHDNEGHSAVHWAIVSSEKEALEMIIRAGANPSTPDIHGGYPLHYAVQMCGSNCEYLRSFEETIRVVESLLNVGVDVNVKDKDGRQPILWAASAGSADAVIHLVSSGACVEAADKDGLTALHCAASRGHTTTLETLISLCGANVDVIDGNGCSALFYSVTLGHADATELLLQLGAEPNRQDRKGRTPAHCGAAKGQLETLRILQKHGGNLWMRNVKGDIPLHEAVASGRKDLVIWLLSQNSEAINLANNDGRCPLHIASMYNNTEMVKVLLDSKSLVNPVMRTSKGVLMTPLNVALCKGHRSCGKYLQLHGGVPFSKVSRTENTSVFAVRVSPSEDVVDEHKKENLLSPQNKISKSRSSSDIQENQEVLKTETIDKKKVYRRRKKKKIQSKISPNYTQDSGSGSEDSVHELKVKIIDNRKSEESNVDGDKDDEKVEKKEQDATVLKKEKSPKNSTIVRKTRSTKKQEVIEEDFTAKNIKRKPESKSSLQRNKSFNETKNVSDLSPEDFPPRMQTINQLDTVIMEPDVDVVKPEAESNEFQDAAVADVTSESVTIEVNTRDEINDKGNFDGSDLQNEENIVEGNSKGKEAEETLQGETKKVVEVTKPTEENLTDETKSATTGRKNSNGESSARKSVKSSSGESLEKRSLKKASEGSDKKTISSNPTVADRSEKPSDAEADNNNNKEIETVESNIINGLTGEEEIKTGDDNTPELISEEKQKEEVGEIQTSDPVVEEPNEEEKKDLLEENSAAENIAEDKEIVPTEVENTPDEEKTVKKEEAPVILESRNERELSLELKKIETTIPSDNFEKSPAEPFESSEPSVVFLSEVAKNTSETNNPENSSEPTNVTQNPTRENPILETQNHTDEVPEEEEEEFVNLNQNGESTVERNSDALDWEEDKTQPEENKVGGSQKFEQRHHKTPRVSRLCRRHREFKDDMNQMSVTQLVQNTIRKYHMERGIFYQLLELKRYQIRSGKANEQVLVKRLADEYDRSRVFLGMKPFSGLYKFREFEKFLYDQLKAINARRSFIFPEIKSYDDIDALSGFLKKSRYKIISEIPQPEMVCTCITQRCHHSACAYTSVPCSAYITDLRRHRHHKPKRESFFPRIEQPSSQKLIERPATLELIQGSEKHVITLPPSSPAKGKRYYVTFTIKGAPGFKEEDLEENSKNYFKHRHAKSV